MAIAGEPDGEALYELPRDYPRSKPVDMSNYDPLLGIAWGSVDVTSLSNGFVEDRLAAYQGTQMNFHRFGAVWNSVEIVEDGQLTGEYDWSIVDQKFDLVEEIGGQALPALLYGPPGEVIAACDESDNRTLWGRRILPEYEDDWVRYVAAFVARYGDRVDHYEIWNEPDGWVFFYDTVERFSSILALADSVINAGDPTAETILGGLAFPGWQGTSWLTKLLQQPGQPVFDILGVHGYEANQLKNLGWVDEAYTSVSLDPSAVRIWVTETGAWAGSDQTAVDTQFRTPRSQEAYVHRTLARWADSRVEAVFWYKGWEVADEAAYGLLDLAGAPRPAFDALDDWSVRDFSDEFSVFLDADYVGLQSEDRYRGVYPVFDAKIDAGQFQADRSQYASVDREATLTGQTRGFAIIDPNWATGGKLAGLHLAVDDSWRYEDARDYVVTVQFKGDVYPRFRIRYHNSDQRDVPTKSIIPHAKQCPPPDPDVLDTYNYTYTRYWNPAVADWSGGAGGYVDPSASVLPDEDGIRTATFNLQDARLGNDGTKGSDFTIEIEPGATEELWIARVEIAAALMTVETPTDVGLDFAGASPYGVLPVDVDENEWEDLLLTVAHRLDGDPLPELYLGQPPIEDGRAWFVPDVDAFGSSYGESARGAVAARLEPGGDFCFLLATPATQSQIFTYDGSSFVPESSISLPTGVWAGAFADYDLDGDLDLYLARAASDAGVGEAVTPSSIQTKGLADQLLEYRYGEYVDVTSAALPYAGPSETISATWADVNGDRFPDLFVSYLGDGSTSSDAFQWSPLYVNQRDGTFLDRAWAAMGSPVDPEYIPDQIEPMNSGVGSEGIHQIDRVSGARFIDIDSDGDLDFFATREPVAGNRGLLSLTNRHTGSGYFQAIGSAQFLVPTRDAAIVDLDNDGIVDLIAAPSDGGEARVSTHLGYLNAAGEVAWRDISGFSGLTPGQTGGLTTTDFDGDGDIDLVYGRDEDDLGLPNYYFSNVSGAGNLVALELNADGSGNAELGVGACVSVSAGGATQVRYVSAGAGRGTQDPLVVRFGVGPETGASYSVTWPDGSVKSGTVTAGPENMVTVFDDHDPELDDASVVANMSVDPSYLSVDIEWETEYATSSSVVTIEMTGGDSPCRFGYTGKKGSGSTFVTFVVDDQAPDGFGYQKAYDHDTQRYKHRLSYTRSCEAPCSYRYRVISKSKDRSENSGWNTVNVSGCANVQG